MGDKKRTTPLPKDTPGLGEGGGGGPSPPPPCQNANQTKCPPRAPSGAGLPPPPPAGQTDPVHKCEGHQCTEESASGIHQALMRPAPRSKYPSTNNHSTQPPGPPTAPDRPPPPRVTFRRVVVPLWGPGQSPGLPSACCAGSLRSVGRCGRCSCWFRVRVSGAQSLALWGCAGWRWGRFLVFAAQSPPRSGRPPPHHRKMHYPPPPPQNCTSIPFLPPPGPSNPSSCRMQSSAAALLQHSP